LLAQAVSPAGLIAIGVVAILAIASMVFFGPKDNGVSLSKIRHNSTAYDGQLVKVHGKVGEVYPVGGGYSFYLLQGRDTMVVFTRSRTPVTNERVSVSGVVSTGVLNGQVRQAILETTPQPLRDSLRSEHLQAVALARGPAAPLATHLDKMGHICEVGTRLS